VAASKGQGVFVFKDSLFQQFTIADGLTANMIENVYVDERNTIWAGTLNGLNRISGFSWSGDQQLRIKQFTTKNGLPSDEINKVEVWEDEVWVATTKGLIHFQNQIETDSFSRAPIIKGVSINGKVLDSIQSFSRAHTDNDLIFHFLTLNFRQDGQIPYRYRLQPVHSDWRETRVTQVNYSTLRPGRYVFEVQSQNEDGIWSNSTPFAFRIRPPWWESWWAISLGILGVASLGLGIYKYRTGQLKKELSLERQLAEVERQALRSQMNPHFIFNSLNAIQGYIAIGDKASANRYLSRFAKLIRAALQHSRLTKVPLDEDIRSLQNYLELEQLRFQDRFDFHFQVAENIDAERVEIPPLLVQPFVENAIVHGMASKTEKGLIEIDYALKDDVLKVTVLDNGIGIEASKNRKLNLASSHKSIGLTVTRRRLEMLTGNGEAGKVYIQELKDEHGNTMGTKAVVWIPV
jgi:signal transduction histidine kinase